MEHTLEYEKILKKGRKKYLLDGNSKIPYVYEKKTEAYLCYQKIKEENRKIEGEEK